MECPKCGSIMLLWQKGLVYRDCEDPTKIVWRCVKYGCGHILERIKGDTTQNPVISNDRH